MSRGDTEERVVVRVTANLLFAVGVVAVLGLAGCGHQGRVSADIDFEVAPKEETSKDETQ